MGETQLRFGTVVTQGTTLANLGEAGETHGGLFGRPVGRPRSRTPWRLPRGPDTGNAEEGGHHDPPPGAYPWFYRAAVSRGYRRPSGDGPRVAQGFGAGRPRTGGTGRRRPGSRTSLGPARHPGGLCAGTPPRRARPNTLMILPQVHLRKPCYDFYFL